MEITLKTKPQWFGDIAAVIYGAALVLAFAPFNLFILSIIIPALLLILLLNAKPGRAFFRAWLFGISFMAAGVSWVYVSLHVYGQANIWVAGGLTTAFILLMGAFYGLLGFILARFFPYNILSKCLLVYPALWVLLEWARNWFLTGFPWLFLGYSQLHSPLSGLAPIFSVYGVSWATVFTSSLIVIVLLTRRLAVIFSCLLIGVALWSLSFILHTITWTHPIGNPIRVALIQGNIPQEVKWRPEQALESFNLYKSLTAKNLDSQIIIWPEAAITLPQDQIMNGLDDLSQLLAPGHNTLIAGIPIIENDAYYNGMIVLGQGSGSYRKRHLVPFGEYMPLRMILNWLNGYLLIPMSDISRGATKQPPMQVDGRLFAGSICYEIAFPTEPLKDLPQSQFLVVISDDSWFGKSFAPAQHAQMAQMRALETGRYILMSTNDAITAIIDAKGVVQNFALPFEEFVLTGHLQAMTGSTPWVMIGIYPIVILLFILLIWGFVLQNIYYSRHTSDKAQSPPP